MELSVNGDCILRDYNTGDYPLTVLKSSNPVIAYLKYEKQKLKTEYNNPIISCYFMHRTFNHDHDGEGDNNVASKLIGLPQQFHVKATWSCKKVRMVIWSYVSKLICTKSKLGKLLEISKKDPKKYVELLNVIMAALPVRFTSAAGIGKFSKFYKEDIRSSVKIGDTDYANFISWPLVQSSSRDGGGTLLPFDENVTISDFSGKSSYVFLSIDWIHEWFVSIDHSLLTKIDQHNSSIESFGNFGKNSSKNSSRTVVGDISLEQCFQEYTKEEKLRDGNTWYCSECKEEKTDAKKMIKFSRIKLPQILIITLKRFEHRDYSRLVGRPGAGHAAKIDTLVDFPIDGFDLSPYCNDAGDTEEYDLFAVCNHYGRMGFGHYTAFARDWNIDNSLSDQWLSFDDEDVSLVENINDIKTSAAYTLFYKKRNYVESNDHERKNNNTEI